MGRVDSIHEYELKPGTNTSNSSKYSVTPKPVVCCSSRERSHRIGDVRPRSETQGTAQAQSASFLEHYRRCDFVTVGDPTPGHRTFSLAPRPRPPTARVCRAAGRVKIGLMAVIVALAFGVLEAVIQLHIMASLPGTVLSLVLLAICDTGSTLH